MPRLVVRQWRTLRGRGAQAALGAPPLTPRHVTLTTTANLRFYTQTPATDSKRAAPIRLLNSAILIPSSVQHTHPDDLVNYINPVSRENVARDTFSIFLVTPSFASWLLNDDFFLAKALRQAYSKAFKGLSAEHLSIYALCAVVDKLPTGRAIKTGTLLDDEVSRRTLVPPVGETGLEGVAFATLPASASLLSTSPPSLGKGAIDFILSGKTEDSKAVIDTWRLPLANTVFQTGTPTTMSFSKWTLSCVPGTLALENKMNVSHHGVGMPPANYPSGQTVSALSIPLLPLTLPRQVQGCMGNIIRAIIGPEDKLITASTELEKVVPQFFIARGEPPQPTTAWALVMPNFMGSAVRRKTMELLQERLVRKETASEMEGVLWDRLWQSHPPAWNKLVSQALANGARLHRVLSGGGGWGKKAGLLSLDPIPMRDEVPIRMEDATSSFDGPGDFSTALKPVVQDGDYIQFFTLPSSGSDADVEASQRLGDLKALPKEKTLGWEIGTVPSTVDSIPGGSWQHRGIDPNYVAVFKHSFGALAEGGLVHTRHVEVGSGEPYKLAGTTTVDVPFTRLWTLGEVDISSSKKDSTGSNNNTIGTSACSNAQSTALPQDNTRKGTELMLQEKGGEKTHVRIRRISIDGLVRRIVDSTSVLKKLYHHGKAVARLHKDHRNMVLYMLQRSRGIPSSLTPLSEAAIKARRRQRRARERIMRDFIHAVDNAESGSQILVNNLHGEVQDIHQNIKAKKLEASRRSVLASPANVYSVQMKSSPRSQENHKSKASNDAIRKSNKQALTKQQLQLKNTTTYTRERLKVIRTIRHFSRPVTDVFEDRRTERVAHRLKRDKEKITSTVESWLGGKA